MFGINRKNRRITPKPKTKPKRPKSADSKLKKTAVKKTKPPKKTTTAKKRQPPSLINSGKNTSTAKTAKKLRNPLAAKKVKRSGSFNFSLTCGLQMDWGSLAQGLVLAGISAALLLALPDFRGLWEPWEAAWAQAAREMLQSGHWYHPTLNGWAFEARTPLAYWPLMASFELFGFNALAARLPSIVWAGLIILAVHQLTAGLHNNRAGILAGIATLFSFTLIASSRICLVDLGLVFTLVLSLGGLWSVYLSGEGPALRFWLGSALAFSLGGAGALTLPVICALALGVLTRSLAWWRGLICWPGIALFLIITQGSMLLVGLNNPSYWGYYLLKPVQSSVYYLSPIYLAMGTFPWLCLLPWAWWVRRNQKEYYPGSGFLPLVWMSVAWLLSPALHLGSLALAVLIWVGCAVWLGPALATLAFDDWNKESPAILRGCLNVLALLLLAVAMAYAIAPWLFTGVSYEDMGASLLLVPSLAAGMAFLIFQFRGRSHAGLSAPLAVILAMGIGLGAALPGLDREHSLKRLVEVASGEIKSQDLLVSYGYYWPGLNYYTGRQVIMAAGQPQRMNRFHRVPGPGGPRHISLGKLLGYMKSDNTRVLAVARSSDYRALEKRVKGMAGLLLFDWARRGDWVLFSNRPL